jgi:hypothetical protein
MLCVLNRLCLCYLYFNHRQVESEIRPVKINIINTVCLLEYKLYKLFFFL